MQCNVALTSYVFFSFLTRPGFDATDHKNEKGYCQKKVIGLLISKSNICFDVTHHVLCHY